MTAHSANATIGLRTRGFTLIELLLVVVIIGILASIAIPKFSNAREKAYMAAVVTDMKVLATQQEAYQSEYLTYAADTDLIQNFTTSPGVNIVITEVDLGQGWAATGWHTGLVARPCGIYYGTASAANGAPAMAPGSVTCTP
jgi:prepilin-type N-terminal cleavage/methylation domain-containing protein